MTYSTSQYFNTVSTVHYWGEDLLGEPPLWQDHGRPIQGPFHGHSWLGTHNTLGTAGALF